MHDDFDGLRASLRASADGFRPHLDAGELARAGRQVQRRNRALGGIAGLAVLVVAAGFGVPAILNTGTERPAFPATVPSDAPPSTTPVRGDEGSEIPGDKGTLPAGVALPHEGKPAAADEGAWESVPWTLRCTDLTPVTVNLPAAARIRAQEIPEGTNGEGVLAFANEADAAAFMGRLRDGYAACPGTGAPLEGGYRDRMASGTETPRAGAEAFSVRIWAEQSEGGSWRDAPGASYDLVVREGSFVALARVGGEFLGDPAGSPEAGRVHDVAAAILTSTRASGGSTPGGDPAQGDFARMSKPGRALSSEGWPSLEVQEANVGLRVAPGWTVVREGPDVIPGMVEIRARSGYRMAVSTVDGLARCTERQPGWESLGEVQGLRTGTRDAVTGPAEIVWANGGEMAVWVGLALDHGAGACFETYLDFGKAVPVYVGALGGNDVNPTPEELDQAVAMLASVRRLT